MMQDKRKWDHSLWMLIQEEWWILLNHSFQTDLIWLDTRLDVGAEEERSQGLAPSFLGFNIRWLLLFFTKVNKWRNSLGYEESPGLYFYCASLGKLTDQPGGVGRQAKDNMNLPSQREINLSLCLRTISTGIFFKPWGLMRPPGETCIAIDGEGSPRSLWDILRVRGWVKEKVKETQRCLPVRQGKIQDSERSQKSRRDTDHTREDPRNDHGSDGRKIINTLEE